jgi:hypothetical protein
MISATVWGYMDGNGDVGLFCEYEADTWFTAI